MSDISNFTELDAGFARLDNDLRQDTRRVAPDDEASSGPGDIVFFADRSWRSILVELAYLPDVEAALAIGLNSFLQEARNDPSLRQFSAALEALSDIAARGDIDPSDDLFAVDSLLEALADSLSFASDAGDVEIAGHVPGMGEMSVWSRIVQSRLDRLGTLLDTAVGRPWGEEEMLSLRRLNRLLGGTPHAVSTERVEELLRLCGDADAMIAQLRAQDPGGFLVAQSGSFPGRRDAFYKRLRVGTDGFFSTAPLINLSPALRRIKTGGRVTHRIAKPIHDDAETARLDPSNTLGLRLVQIKLWQLGYYDDFIDALIGPNTISALLEALEIYGGTSSSEARLDIIRRLGDGYIAINLHGLDKLVFSVSGDAVLSSEEKAEFVAQATAKIVERGAPEAPSSTARYSEAPPLREGAREAGKGRLGRIGRGLFRTVGRALRSLAAAVKRGVQKMVIAVDRMLAPVRNAMGIAFSQIGKIRSLLALVLIVTEN